jgi:hypothetical protein
MTKRLVSRCGAVTFATGVATLTFLVLPAVANDQEHFFAGGLSPSRIYASGSAHTHMYYIEAVKDHRACVGHSTGWGGYSPPGFGTFYYDACKDGSGLAYAYPGKPPEFYHGAVLNPNSATNIHVSDSHYTWITP